GERIRLVVRAKHVPPAEYQPKIVVKSPDRNPVTLIPTRLEQDSEREAVYAAFFTPENEGEFEAVLSNNVGQPREDTARFTVYSDSVETRLVAADRELLPQTSKITGGPGLPL